MRGSKYNEVETTTNGTSAELTPKRSQGQLEGKEKGMKLKLNDDCWKRTRSVEGEKNKNEIELE